MRAARLSGVGEMALAILERPVPARGEVLVRVEAAGICGSDRHMIRGEYPTALPVTLGHEFCGIIEELGPGVTRLTKGQRITADPNIPCGHCEACSQGRVNLCSSLQAIGVTRDGGFAEYVLVPESHAIVLPDDLDPMLGAFSEPLACCLHGLDVARIKLGDSVAVFGGGVIGLIMLQLVRLAGADRVIVSTRQKERRALAMQLGATHCVDGGPDVLEAIDAIVPGGVDVTLECAGVPETFTQSLAAVRRGGAAVLFGVMPKGQSVAVEPFDLLTREVRLEAAWLNPHTHGRAAAMIGSGALLLEPLISRVVGIGDVPNELAGEPHRGEVKVMVRP